MKEEYDVKKMKNEESNVNRKCNRKFKSWKFVIVFIIVLIIILFISSTIRKYVILLGNNENLQNVINSNNYHWKIDTYSENSIFSQEIYKKDDKHLYISYSNNKSIYETISPVVYAIYYDGQNTYIYNEDEKTKIKYYTTSEGDTNKDIFIPEKLKSSDILLRSIFSKIDTTIMNGKSCYRIIPSRILINNNLDDDNIEYIEKDTGFPIRSISTNNLSNYTGMCEYSMELNTVTDNDLIIPNIEEYRPYEEIKEMITPNEDE